MNEKARNNSPELSDDNHNIFIRHYVILIDKFRGGCSLKRESFVDDDKKKETRQSQDYQMKP